MVHQRSKLDLHAALGSLFEAHVRWRLSKSWYCSWLLPESRNFILNISVHTSQGPLPTNASREISSWQGQHSPCSHKRPAKNFCWCKHKPQQQQAVPKAEMVMQQGVSGCCQEHRAWCQLRNWKGLQLPRGVKQYPLPEGRKQRRGRMNNHASKQVTFDSLFNLHSYRSKSTPEGSTENL